jgi:hypothetical protein
MADVNERTAEYRHAQESTKSVLIRVLREAERRGAIANDDSFNRVLSNSKRMERGLVTDMRTPFYGSRKGGQFTTPPREEIVSILDEGIARAHKDETFIEEVLLPLEEDQKQDIGPWSPYDPWSQDGPKKARAVYSDKSSTQLNKVALDKALDRLQSLVPTQSLNPISLEIAIHGLPKGEGAEGDISLGLEKGTNSGAPYFLPVWYPSPTMGRATKSEVLEAYNYYLRLSKDVIQGAQTPGFKTPLQFAVAFQRLVQKANPEKRKRLVIGFPKWEAMVWKTLTPPAIEVLKNVRIGDVLVMCAWHDLPTIDLAMQAMLSGADGSGRTVLSGDVSNFDASLIPSFISDVGRTIATWFRGASRLCLALVEGMVYNTALITPTELFKPGPSSLKSGSGGTNFIGSMANLAIQFYGEELGLYKIQTVCVLGDDFVIDGEGVSPEATSECFKHFGMESHPDKQFYVKNCLHYLQRLHVLGRVGGIASVYRTLGHALGFEHLEYKSSDWNEYSFVIRALSQLQNCVFNPFFLQLVQVLRDGDKLELGAKFTNPTDMLERSGTAGKEMLRINTTATWKRVGSDTSFENWLVNGVLRGEQPPPPGDTLFRRVYGVG